MMTSSNENICRVTGHLCGEFTGHRWIPRTKASDGELWCFLWSASEDWVNSGEAGELRRYRAHYAIIVMISTKFKSKSNDLILILAHDICIFYWENCAYFKSECLHLSSIQIWFCIVLLNKLAMLLSDNCVLSRRGLQNIILFVYY